MKRLTSFKHKAQADIVNITFWEDLDENIAEEKLYEYFESCLFHANPDKYLMGAEEKENRLIFKKVDTDGVRDIMMEDNGPWFSYYNDNADIVQAEIEDIPDEVIDKLINKYCKEYESEILIDLGEARYNA